MPAQPVRIIESDLGLSVTIGGIEHCADAPPYSTVTLTGFDATPTEITRAGTVRVERWSLVEALRWSRFRRIKHAWAALRGLPPRGPYRVRLHDCDLTFANGKRAHILRGEHDGLGALTYYEEA